MADDPGTTETFTPPPSEQGSTGFGSSPAAADHAATQQSEGDRPELIAAGAFAGAFVFAKILKRLGGSD